MFKYIILSLLFFTNLLLAEGYQTTYSKDQIMEDFKKGDIQKYRNDTLKTFTKDQLVKSNIISSSSTLSSDALVIDCSSFLNNQEFTATAYRVDAKGGNITCMFAQKDNLYNPIGLFQVKYPKIKALFKLDIPQAEADNASIISSAKNSFDGLIAEKNRIANTQQSGEGHLTIPQLLLATVLTDSDVIDVEASHVNGKIKLQGQYNSTVINSDGTFSDNTDMIANNISGIFQIYTGYSNIAFTMMLTVAVAFMTIAGGLFVVNAASAKIDKDPNAHGGLNSIKKTPWIIGMMTGSLLFFPYNEKNIQTESDGAYTVMKTHYQDMSEWAFYLSDEYAHKMAKITIDTSLNTLIGSAGISNSHQLINSYAGKKQSQKLLEYTTALQESCSQIYEISNMTNADKVSIYSDNGNSIYPSSELFAFAKSWYNPGGKDYYNEAPNGLIKDGTPNGTYPRYSFSACGSFDHMKVAYQQKLNDYTKTYNDANIANQSVSQKTEVVRNSINFQNELYRDFGYLSILALPIISAQAESVAVHDPKNNNIAKMNEQISGGNFFVGTLHSFISTLPYTFLPGAQAVFNITAANSRLIGASTGAAIGSSTGDGSTFDKVLHGVIGGAAGFAAGYLAPESIAYPVMILYLKALLSIAPALTIITFGLLRFLTIMLKILAVHFLSLLILPAIFLAKNLDYLKSFSVKVFSVVLEIPLFVLAINIAVVAQMMFHSVGDSFNKRVILGMLQNNAAMSSGKEITIENLNLDNLEYLTLIKIYGLDGFAQITIAILAVVMSYVIINKLHVMVTEFLELNAERTLDGAVDTLTNETKQFGGRI